MCAKHPQYTTDLQNVAEAAVSLDSCMLHATEGKLLKYCNEFLLLQRHFQLFACNQSDVQDIISAFQPKLQQLSYKVRTVAATSNIRLGITNAYISDRISTSALNIQKQLDSLQETVDQAQYNSGSEEEISVCLEQVQNSASAIDTDEFSACRRNEQIAELRRKIVTLKGLTAEIDQTITACRLDAGIEALALRACLQNSVDNIDVSLQQQDSQIGSGIDEIIIGVDQCISKVEEELEETIVEIANNFLRCVGNNSIDRASEERYSDDSSGSNDSGDED